MFSLSCFLFLFFFSFFTPFFEKSSKKYFTGEIFEGSKKVFSASKNPKEKQMTTRRWGTHKSVNEPQNDDDDNNQQSPDDNNNDKKNETTIKKPSTPTSAKQVLDTAIGTRKETIHATNRILQDLEHVKALEIEALEVLHRDLDRLRRVEGNLTEIDSTMERSRMQIVAIARKLYRDGCFKICVVLLLCAIIVVAVMLAMEGFDKIGKGIGGGGSNVVVVTGGGGDLETRTTTTTHAATTTT